MKNIRKIDMNYYQKLVSKICRDIAITDWRPDYIVGIVRGGLLPAVMVSHYFNIPMYTLNVKLRDHEECESNLWMSEDAFGYLPGEHTLEDYKHEAKNILLVDDINDSGATINWIMNDWQSSCLPKNERWNSVWNHNVKFATVFDNSASKSKVIIDFIGEDVVKSKKDWIEFPYENWWA